MERQNVTFTSDGGTCAGWLYITDEPAIATVVMAHGLAGVKEMRLDAYAERFASAGYNVLVFDYRHFGASDGTPRQLLDLAKQRKDWVSAVAFVRRRPDVDGPAVALWGSSLSGGHVLAVASQVDAAAIISQVPHTDGPASTLAAGPAQIARLTWHALRDVARSLTGRGPHYVPAAGAPGDLALMTEGESAERYLGLVPEGYEFDQRVAARLILHIALYSPGRHLKRLTMPVLLQVGTRDRTTPARATLKHASRSRTAIVRTYDVGHFEPYTGDLFETFVAEQLGFLDKVLSRREVSA